MLLMAFTERRTCPADRNQDPTAWVQVLPTIGMHVRVVTVDTRGSIRAQFPTLSDVWWKNLSFFWFLIFPGSTADSLEIQSLVVLGACHNNTFTRVHQVHDPFVPLLCLPFIAQTVLQYSRYLSICIPCFVTNYE